MGITVDIDNGGTFTDGYFTRGSEIRAIKVDTTPHDLTVCFMNCLEEGAKEFGYANLSEFLRETAVIRFSTTAGTNAIIQRKGPRIGLITTAGREADLYAMDQPSVRGELVAEDMIAGLPRGASEEAVRDTVRGMLESGARLLVVSLEDSFANPEEEQRIKQLIKEDYPKQYLGAVPVLLASEVTARPGALERTNVAVINGFLHKEMVRTLYKADEDLRKAGYKRPLLVAHVNGGAARVAKTRAIDTYNSGPVAGLMGTAYTARLYNLPNVVSIDIGGTSTDVGVIVGGEYTYNFHPAIAGVPVNTPFIDVPTVGGGGGSIARVDAFSGELTVGPESAGAMPGPACYDMGGTEPTVTDADVVLGYIDPDFFLGGRRRLSKEKALQAIREQVAEPLGVSVEEAALSIRGRLVQIGADAVGGVLAAKGQNPRDFVLFAFGGGGGSFGAEIGATLGISQIYTFASSAVFSAMGLSTADVVHSYEQAVRRPLSEAAGVVSRAVAGFEESALRDMRGEGFGAQSVSVAVELEVSDGRTTRVVPLARPQVESGAGLEEVRSAFGEASGELQVDIVRVKATGQVPHNAPKVCEAEGSSPAAALKGSRQVYRDGGWNETDVYDHARLRTGNVVQGPSVIEAVDSTYAVPAGATYRVDAYLNGIMEWTR